MFMQQYYRSAPYFRPGVTTVSVVSPRGDDQWRSKTSQRYTNPVSTSGVGSSSRLNVWLLGVSWAGSLAAGGYAVLYPATNSDSRFPYGGQASGPTPAPESNFGMEDD